jgi:hypothetical protein
VRAAWAAELRGLATPLPPRFARLGPTLAVWRADAADLLADTGTVPVVLHPAGGARPSHAWAGASLHAYADDAAGAFTTLVEALLAPRSGYGPLAPLVAELAARGLPGQAPDVGSVLAARTADAVAAEVRAGRGSALFRRLAELEQRLVAAPVEGLPQALLWRELAGAATRDAVRRAERAARGDGPLGDGLDRAERDALEAVLPRLATGRARDADGVVVVPAADALAAGLAASTVARTWAYTVGGVVHQFDVQRARLAVDPALQAAVLRYERTHRGPGRTGTEPARRADAAALLLRIAAVERRARGPPRGHDRPRTST